jgi:hypothetical protein
VKALAQRASITGGVSLTVGCSTAIGLAIVCRVGHALAGVCGAGLTSGIVGGARIGVNVTSSRIIGGTYTSRCGAGSGLAVCGVSVKIGSIDIGILCRIGDARSGSFGSGFITHSGGSGFLLLLSFQR